jgi:lambda repressor-like predicted transcriptional regulator
MHFADIQAQLKKAGWSQERVAIKTGYSKQHVSSTLRGVRRSRAIAAAVAEITGRPISELWPGLYDEPQGAARAKKAA